MYDIPDFLRIPAEMQNHFAKGGMIKRADGSYSRRGLWDNIRANKGSGKKPTKQMLEQEARIKAKEYVVGGPITFSAGGEKHKVYEKESPTGNGKGVEGHIMVTHPTMDKGKWDTIDLTEIAGAHTVTQGVNATKKWHEENPEYGGGGYIVRRSHDRKGKTHVVIGPDGTKKYFGDAKLGQHPHDAARKKAFYARHKHNLDHNPYFRAFARKTWEDGGEVPEYDYGGFYGRNEAAKMQRMFTPNANSMSPKFGMGGRNIYQSGTTNVQTVTSLTSQNKRNEINLPQSSTYNPWQVNTFGATSPIAQQTPSAQSAGFGNQNQVIIPNALDPTSSKQRPKYEEDGLDEPSMNEENKSTEQESWQPSTGSNGMSGMNRFGNDNNWANENDGTGEKEETDWQRASKELMGDQNVFGFSNTRGAMKKIGNAVDKTLTAGLYGADFISRALPQSFENAPLNFNRKIANDSTNTMNIVGNRKGIEYSAYGGVTGYKEGEELDLTAQQIYALEKQGYKFQTL